MTTAQVLEKIDTDKVAAVLTAETPRWRAVCDGSWAAANSRSIERRAYRVDVAVVGRRTPVRVWAWIDDEDSRWEGEGHSETWRVGAVEPTQIVGGWGGGLCEDISRHVVHVDLDEVA